MDQEKQSHYKIPQQQVSWLIEGQIPLQGTILIDETCKFLISLADKLLQKVKQRSNLKKNSQIQLPVTGVAMEEKGDGNFKFTPTTFRQLKRRRFDHSGGVIETWMQFENNSLDNRPKIFV